MDALTPDEATLADTLFPFTWTRSVLDIRVGILTLREKWERMGMPDLAPAVPRNVLPSPELIAALLQESTPAAMEPIMAKATVIRHPWHIFELNGLAIRNDFALLTKGRQSQ